METRNHKGGGKNEGLLTTHRVVSQALEENGGNDDKGESKTSQVRDKPLDRGVAYILGNTQGEPPINIIISPVKKVFEYLPTESVKNVLIQMKASIYSFFNPVPISDAYMPIHDSQDDCQNNPERRVTYGSYHD